jgi:hemerythrin
MLNSFLQSSFERTGNEKNNGIIKNLEYYTEKHFEVEELFMIKEEFPRLADHKKEHQKIAKDIENHRKIIVSKGISKSLIDDFSEWFEECVTHHLFLTDKIFRDFVKTKKSILR